MERNSIAVIGLGNLLMGDEGVGLIALDSIAGEWNQGGVDFIHAGTPSMGLLHYFEGRRKLVILDGGMCGAKIGEWKRFEPEEVRSRKPENGLSLHQFDLVRLIDIASKLGLSEHTEVVIYCMEIERMEWGEGLSEHVEHGLPGLVRAVKEELAKTHE
jgi:hydrogenase maturation protease